MISQDNIAKSSFFDSLDTNSESPKNNVQELWLTTEEFEKKYSISFEQITKGNLLFSGIMCKQDKAQDINEYFFKLYDQFLVQCTMPKNKSRIIAIMPLLFVKLEFQEITEADDELPFFLMTRNQQFDILVPDTHKNFDQWLKFFKTRCIMSFFGEEYQNTKIIGKGSFAKVMLCVRNSDKKEFAVKIYDKKKIMQSKNYQLTKFGIQNEIKLMQQLNHKNIIKLHEVYEGQFHVYLVLDLLTGGELFSKLQTKDSYSEKEACILITNLLEAVDYLHSQGIMHRDIKPENLIFRNEGEETEIVLADFGLSEKVTNFEDLIFKRCGTPGYVAPEILNNLPYDTQVDVFSIGIILYIILTGYAPFFGDYYDEILEKNKKCNICYDFKKININLSSQALDLLKSMLNPNPNQRITAKQALNHPWIKNFSTDFEANSQVGKLQFQYSTASLLKQTKPKNSGSKNLIMHSPLITGNINEIKSPFNAGSPEVLQYTPVQDREKCSFTYMYEDAMSQLNPKVKEQKHPMRNNKATIKKSPSSTVNKK